MQKLIDKRISEHRLLLDTLSLHNQQMILAAQTMQSALQNGKKLLFCGNGGSAADAQHFAAEFVGRFVLERDGLPAIALTTDTSILTAVGNDYGFETIFARQVQALGASGDVLIAYSTSGNSANVVLAIQEAKRKGLKVIGFTGYGGGKMRDMCDVCIAIDCKVTARVQEMHTLLGHILCELLDGTVVSDDAK